MNSEAQYNMMLQSGKKKPIAKTPNLGAIIGPTQQRTLTLKQLRELINDMYTQKTKFDQKCEEGRQAKETME